MGTFFSQKPEQLHSIFSSHLADLMLVEKGSDLKNSQFLSVFFLQYRNTSDIVREQVENEKLLRGSRDHIVPTFLQHRLIQ